MAHTLKKNKKRLLPKDITQRTGHEIMEKIFGKRAMKEVDKLVEERSKGVEEKEINNII